MVRFGAKKVETFPPFLFYIYATFTTPFKYLFLLKFACLSNLKALHHIYNPNIKKVLYIYFTIA